MIYIQMGPGLHGTDRGHNKFVGHQMTTYDQGTLSTGFVGVHSENSDTLLHVAIHFMKQLTHV